MLDMVEFIQIRGSSFRIMRRQRSSSRPNSPDVAQRMLSILRKQDFYCTGKFVWVQ